LVAIITKIYTSGARTREREMQNFLPLSMTDLTNTSVHLVCKLATVDQSMKCPVTVFVPEVQLSAGTNALLLFTDAFVQSLLTNQPPLQITAGSFHSTRSRSSRLTTLLCLLNYIDFLGSFTSTSPLHLFNVLIKRAKNFMYCTCS